MKTLSIPFTLLLLGMLTRPLPGENIRFGLNDSVKVRMEGTSNINQWECDGETLELKTDLVLNGATFRETLQLAWQGNLPLPLRVRETSKNEPAPFTLQVPVDSLKCTRRRMQQDLRKAVKFDQHPLIRYELVEIREITPVDGEKETVRVKLSGSLVVAGVPRDITHEIDVTRLDTETFQIRGQLDLKMTWFEMEPPTALMGLVKARDRFEVGFLFQARTEPVEQEVTRDLVRLVSQLN